MMLARRRALFPFALLAGLVLGTAMSLPVHAQGTGKACDHSSAGLTPLIDLVGGEYQKAPGGLYPDGSNQAPLDHLELGKQLASEIQPLDPRGSPDSRGLIGLVAIGVSNTRQEFAPFIELANDLPEKNPQLVLVNAAQGGRHVDYWLDPEDRTWQRAEQSVTRVGATHFQVQVAWVKLPAGHRRWRAFPSEAEEYAAALEVALRNLRIHFPNVKLAYLSSRIYGGYTLGEPTAYEQGFSVRWIIEDQMAGDADLNPDPAVGPVRAPWLAWGPYLWADGANPRSDGLTWQCEDLADDGIHPSASGQDKVARLLLDHFTADPTTASWFLGVAPVREGTTTMMTTASATTITPLAQSTPSVSASQPRTRNPWQPASYWLLAGLAGILLGGALAGILRRRRPSG